MANDPTIGPTAAQADVIRRRVNRALREALYELRTDPALVALSGEAIEKAAVRYCWRWCAERRPEEFWAGADRCHCPACKGDR